MDILKEGSMRVKKIPLEAHMQVVLNANAGIFFEAEKMGNRSLTFDDVLVKLGYTARWEEEGREEAAGNALAKGLPLDTIGEITGLDIEIIKSFAGK
jgi:hypothetical protein